MSQSIAVLNSTFQVSNSIVYTTTGITPSADKLILAFISRTMVTDSTGLTLSGNGMTWTLITDITTSSALIHNSVLRAMSSVPTSGTVSIILGSQAFAISYAFVEVTGAATSGTGGSGAILQSASTFGPASSAWSVNFTTSSGATNAVYGALTMLSTGGTISAGSSFVEITENLPSSFDAEVEWFNGPSSNMAWTLASTSKQWCALGIEVMSASASVAPFIYPKMFLTMGIGV